MNKKTTPTLSLSASEPMLAYLEYRQKIADGEAQITQLEGLIASKQQESAEAQAKIPDLSHLTTQRQELHADLAMGKATEDQVAVLDQEIATKQAERTQIASSAKQIIDAAEHAIAGLQRRLDSTRAEINALENIKVKQRLVSAVLKHHAETLGVEYVKAAQQVNALYMRLMALSGMYQSNGYPQGLASHCVGAYEIPSFKLEACQPHDMKNWPGNLFLGQIYTPQMYLWATDEEREFLHAAGLVSV